MTHNERKEAVERLLRERYAMDHEAFVSHTEIAACLDVKPPNDPDYYVAVCDVRDVLLTEDIALGTCKAGQDTVGGYRFLPAPDHGERNHQKFLLLVERINSEIAWGEAFLVRVDKNGEDPGMPLAEYLMSKTFTNDARRAVATFTGQMEALAVIRKEQGEIDGRKRELERKQRAEKERLSRVRQDRRAVITSLRGKLRNREERLRALESGDRNRPSAE